MNQISKTREKFCLLAVFHPQSIAAGDRLNRNTFCFSRWGGLGESKFKRLNFKTTFFQIKKVEKCPV